MRPRSRGLTYLTGVFQGSVDFGGGALMSDGSFDGFVAKFTSAGAFVSNLAFGDVGDQIAGRIDVDASGNRYLTGSFVGTIDLGDGPLVADTLSDVFVAKLAP